MYIFFLILLTITVLSINFEQVTSELKGICALLFYIGVIIIYFLTNILWSLQDKKDGE